MLDIERKKSMKVREKFYKKDSGREVSVEQLIEIGCAERNGQVEQLEARVDNIVRIVAGLIERGGFTGEDVLKITGSEWKVELDV